jgi:hypothetical protein
MAALTDDRRIKREDAGVNSAPVAASTTIYKGALVCYNSNGYAVPAADTAGFVFAGVAREQVDNSAGGNGDDDVELWTGDVYQFDCSGFTAADVGKSVYAVDDQTVALAATTTNDIKVGTVARFISATKVAVRLELHTGA